MTMKSKPFNTYKKLRPLHKLIVWLIFFFLLYTVLGFIALRPIIHSFSEKRLTRLLNREVDIGSIKVNPYALTVIIEQFRIKTLETDADLLSFDRLFINLHTRSLLVLAPVVEDFILKKPGLTLIRQKNNIYNFEDLLSQLNSTESDSQLPGKSSEPQTESTRPLLFSISNIQISQGWIDFLDEPTGKKHTLRDINLSIPIVSNIGTDAQVHVQPKFSAKVNDSQITLSAKSLPFVDSLQSEINFDLKDIDLKTYFPYFPADYGVTVASGILDLNFDLVFFQKEGRFSGSFIIGKADIHDFKLLSRDGQPFFAFEKLNLDFDKSTLLKGLININRLFIDSPKLRLKQNPDEQLNLFSIGPGSVNQQNQKNSQQAAMPFKISAREIGFGNAEIILLDNTIPEKTPENTPTLFSLSQFAANNLSIDSDSKTIDLGYIQAQDGKLSIHRINHQPDRPLNLQLIAESIPEKTDTQAMENIPPWNVLIRQGELSDIILDGKMLAHQGGGDLKLAFSDISAKNISTQEGEKATVSVSGALNESGKIKINGDVALNTLWCDLLVETSDISLSWFQPFFSEILNIAVTDGKISNHGTFSFRNPDVKTVQADYKGAVSIRDMKVMDNQRRSRVIGWESLDFSGINASFHPYSITLEALALKKPFGSIAIDPDGVLNIRKFLKTRPETPMEPSPDTGMEPPETVVSPLVGIASIRLSEGELTFRDNTIEPNYSATINDIELTMKDVTSVGTKLSDFSMKGFIDRHAPIEVKGTLDPLKTNFFMDMELNCNNLDLVPMSMYAEKYAGYKIRKGKLNLDLDYLIEKRKLESQNNILLDQFTFGSPVKTDHAIDAPFSLAVSLLKDPQGIINLSLPVQGNLDDPEFKVGAVIVKAIMNLFAKAATAPFSLLGAMFGEAKDLNLIDFDPGSSELTEPSNQKLLILVKALKERPGLSLEVTGTVQHEIDSSALAEKRFTQKISDAHQSMIEQAKEGPPFIEIPPGEEAYSIRLKSVYLEQIRSQGLPVPEKISIPMMEKTVKDTIRISDNQLLQLAKERSGAVINFMVDNGGLDSRRIFKIDPDTKVSATQVTLKLK